MDRTETKTQKTPKSNSEADRMKLVSKLFEQWRVLQAQQSELVAEMALVIAGEPGIGERMAQAREAFNAAWKRRYRGEYQWRHTEDAPHLKRFIKALGVDELCLRMARFLQNDDPFFVRSRHGFNVFVSTINQHVGPPLDETELELEAGTAPHGCTHQPPCANAAAHTTRYLTEMRNGS